MIFLSFFINYVVILAFCLRGKSFNEDRNHHQYIIGTALRGEEGSNNKQDRDGEEWPHPSPRLGFIELREEPNRHDKMAGHAPSVSAPHSMRTDMMAKVKWAP